MSYLFGRTSAELLKEETLSEIFASTADLYADNIAIATEKDSVTYRELSVRVERLSAALVSSGIGRGCRVALLMPRGIEACTALLAIMKAGAAYVPVDPAYPDERFQFIIKDCEAQAVITSADLSPRAGKIDGVSLFVLDGASEIISPVEALQQVIDSALETPSGPDDIAYIIYTSGTTGKPKGVPVTHRSACHFVRAEGSIFRLDANACVYHGFSLAFDASVEELWLAWHSGAKLLIAPEDIVRSGQDLNQWLIEQQVTVLSCVPTLLSLFDNDIPSLSLLILGGEVFPPALASRWTDGKRRVVNTYGPTEATVVATFSFCELEKPVTLGRPLPNYIACVLDENLNHVKDCVSGELCLGGPGLTGGYLNRPELNQTKFIAAPKSDDSFAPDRLYRTGDRVKINENGDIEFLGRVDDQVKLRGYRIELGEVEAALRDLPGVSQAAVAVREDSLGMSQLIGYLVPTAKSVVTLEESALRRTLRERLPAFMVPAFLEVIDSVPTLTSGKVDRSSLPEPRAREIVEESLDNGLSETERCIAGIWRKLFATPVICKEDNFFDLGGHSLLAARLASELRQKAEFAAVSVVDVYRNPRLCDLALVLEAVQRSSPAAESEINERSAEAHSQKPKEVGAAGKWSCWTAQLLGLYIAFAIFSLQWYLPWFVFDYFEDSAHRAMYAGLLFLAVVFALEPVQMLFCVALKWIFIGKYKEGDYPLWGFYYWRFWLVHSIYRLFSFANFEGTPFMPIFGRMMGASIGKDVYIGTASQFGDLIEIGDGCSINAGAELHFYRVEDGLLKLRRIRIGNNCDIGQQSFLEGGAVMEDGSTLGPLSLLQEAAVLPKGETWEGSPAKPVQGKDRVAGEAVTDGPGPFRMFSWYFVSFFALAIFPLLAAVPGMLLLAWLDNNYHWIWSLPATPVVCASFMFFYAMQIVLAKRLLLGKVEAGRYPLKSVFHLRYWFIDRLMHTSLDVLFPAYATIYLAPWLRLLGAKLDKRAEVSTIMHFTPDLLELGEEVFLADAVSVGAAHVHDGVLDLQRVKIGAQSFVGNSAVIPGGTELGAKTLIGCLSMPPSSKEDCVRYDRSYMGSPPVFLPNRLINTNFASELTYKPTKKLYMLRAAIELTRMILPGSVLIATSIVLMNLASETSDILGTGGLLLVFPFFSIALGLVAAAVTIAMKWLVIGRYKSGESPLWSPFVWRSELVTALHDYLATPMLLSMLRGTPLIAWYFRALGAKVGKSVYLDSTYMTEFDLVDIGSNSYINSDCDLQTHLFEDRVMKMSHVKLGESCSVGAHSLILYDTNLASGTVLAPLSLVLKGEHLSPAAEGRWIGSPVQAEK